MNLRNWMLGLDEDDSVRSNSTLPPILILDGGVSTFLSSYLQEKKIQYNQNKQKSSCCSCNASDEVEKDDDSSNFCIRELWSSSLLLTNGTGDHDAISHCHNIFLDYSDIISTITYQCQYLICQDDKYNITEIQIDQMLKDGVRLAKEAIQSHKSKDSFVAASIGCYGAAMADGSEYTGSYGETLSLEECIRFHQRKTEVLIDCNPDLLAFETIPCLLECKAILTLLKDIIQRGHYLTPTWISFACKDEKHLNDGSLLTDALHLIEQLDPSCDIVCGIGVNCCAIQHMAPLLKIITSHMTQSQTQAKPSSHNNKRAIVFYPNTGEEWCAKTESWIPNTGVKSDEDFADEIMNGVNTVVQTWNSNMQKLQSEINNRSRSNTLPRMIVGGCCRTSPATISQIRIKVNELKRKK